MDERRYYVYILSNQSNTVLYVGMTNDLKRRVWEHKQGKVDGFTKQYRVNKLVYYEVGEYVISVLEREKQLKSLLRNKKVALIQAFNPDWHDLYDEI